MVAVVQTKSRANRIKLFKKFYRTATPSFRVYHGSRLPPKSFEGRWPHKKFFSSKIKVGAASKGVKPTKVKKLLDTKPKALPKKRKKRGILKKKDVGKKKAVIKRLKRKKVSFSAKGRKSMGLRQDQAFVEIEGRKDIADRTGAEFPAAIRAAAVAPRRRYGRATPGRYRVRSDRQRVGWELNAARQLVRAPAAKRRIMVL
jgi:hypothetical protein